MLISCPKCHNIYEIPDNLIPKTGKKFRCQACAHIWHAMPSDALGYEENKEETPLIEPINVPVPPYRPFPADKEHYQVPADTKSGVKTISSEELIKQSGNPNYTPKITPQLHLMSDEGTSFTIRMPDEKPKTEEPSELYAPKLTADVSEKTIPTVSEKSGKFKVFLLFILVLLALLAFARREVVALFPAAENYYQKVYLSGLQNTAMLSIRNVRIEPTTRNGLNGHLIRMEIKNNSFYRTVVPNLTVQPINQTFQAERSQLNAYETVDAEVFIKHPAESLTISFVTH